MYQARALLPTPKLGTNPPSKPCTQLPTTTLPRTLRPLLTFPISTLYELHLRFLLSLLTQPQATERITAPTHITQKVWNAPSIRCVIFAAIDDAEEDIWM